MYTRKKLLDNSYSNKTLKILIKCKFVNSRYNKKTKKSQLSITPEGLEALDQLYFLCENFTKRMVKYSKNKVEFFEAFRKSLWEDN